MSDTTGRDAATSRIGGLEQLGRFELICVMSRAEYGSTWACVATTAPMLGRVFSMRRIVVSAGDEGQVTEPLIEVTTAWEGMSRPGMVPLVEAVSASGRLGIVSQYVEGEPLRSVLNLAKVRKMPMPRPVALRIATDLVQALVNLLGAPLKKPELAKSTHGGVLPDNVLITTLGETRLTEPGVTSKITKLPVLMRHEKLIAYQAPEQLTGGKIDARTDVFSVGVLLWEMLAGRSLFLSDEKGADEKATEATRKRVLEMPAPRLDDPKLGLEEAVDKAIADVVDRALQKKALARFAALQELATALRKATGAKAASRKDVSTFVAELVGSTLETRRAAIERASLGAPPEPVPKDEAEPSPSKRGGDVVPTSSDIDVDLDFGDGDDLEGDDELEELAVEPATGENVRPPVPPRIEIKHAPVSPSASAPSPPRPSPSPAAPKVQPKPDAKAGKADEAKKDEGEDAKAKDPEKKKEEGSKTEEAKEPETEEAKEPETEEAKEPETEEAKEPETKEEEAKTDDAPSKDEAEAPDKGAEVEPNPFEQPFPEPSATKEPSPEAESEPEAPKDETPDESPDESPDEAPLEPAALAVPELPDEAAMAAERKRKMTFIVGGVVGVAALILVIAGLASMGDDEPGTDLPGASATAPPPPATTTVPPAPEPVASAVPDAAPDVQDAAAEADVADAAKEAEPEIKPPKLPPRPARPRPPKPKPKPYTPSEI